MFGFELHRDSGLSNGKQLENAIREAILTGKLEAGFRLPATRVLARDMQIARNTIVQTYEQLIAEGYLEAREGSGTYVAEIGKLPGPKLGNYTERTAASKKKDRIAFDAGNPDTHSFPRIQWAKKLKEACLEADESALSYNNYDGHPALKLAIRSYVYRMKGIECDESQIIIVPGASGGMELLAKTFKKRENRIALEDPCIHFIKKIFAGHEYGLCPIPVDVQGMDVKQLQELPNVNLIYVVPSHQYPIGGVLPVARRIALLQFAAERNAYVIEDDYDSEFRYKGEALQALRNLDPERVIYLGSFSKIFTPSLRLGYMILPAHLCEPVKYQLQETNLWAGKIEQSALARFMDEKLLDKHIYKMRKLYENKRKYLISCLEDEFGDRIKISGEYAGLHLLVTFDHDLCEKDLQAIEDAGLEVDYVEDYALIKGYNKNKLVLGYGALSMSQMEAGVKGLYKALTE